MMKTKLNAIHDNDLVPLLKKLNLFGKIQKGEVKCKFTNTVITIDNIHSLFPEEGVIKIVCDSPEAIKMFSEYINDKNL